ncbi:tryptophan-rich sensory protein [Mastigocoleus sp. MO_188.B34]|uniref:tryptophan-rich sensory protein n=1 Tax=Mastigocoleus sp. MO_188.B34 TaxID=3036635 RepID=UPI00261D39FA|nr:tryptophan-rich sensory protein [Mastigocoleus sp. MO_188.B34]MDJ0694513.1 tryptophan-rich sensory protein [Mastigocoleus sp. MO_188.B34]
MQHSSSSNQWDFLRQIVTLIAIILAFIVNVASNIFPLNGLTIGQISNTLFKEVLIIPANYAFIIWGLIYLGLFAFATYQVLPNQRNNPDLRKIGYFLVIASIAQSIWVYLFSFRLFTLSVVAMLVILLPLIATYLHLGTSKTAISRVKRWCVHYPMGIYLGWISVATVVNVACALYAQNWNGWGIPDQAWTVIMMLVAAAISIVTIFQNRDLTYTGVTIWALIAIAIKNWENHIIMIVALLCVTALVIISLFKNLKRA